MKITLQEWLKTQTHRTELYIRSIVKKTMDDVMLSRRQWEIVINTIIKSYQKFQYYGELGNSMDRIRYSFY